MGNVILNTVFIGLFIIVIGVFLYMLYDYGTFQEDMKKENDAEEKLIKLVQKNYEYYNGLNNTLSKAVNENTQLTKSLQMSDANTRKRIQDIEKSRMNTIKAFDDNVVKYGEYMEKLNENNKELNNTIRFANVCATAKKIKKQSEDMQIILDLMQQQTNSIWDIIDSIQESNSVIDHRVRIVEYKIKQHETIMQHLMDNNLIIAQNVEAFRQHIESNRMFVDQLITVVARFEDMIGDMNDQSSANLGNINNLNNSNLADRNDIIYLNNEMNNINNTIIELDERASNLEQYIASPEWANINLDELDSRASNLRGTIQGYFSRIEELSAEQSNIVNHIIPGYQTRMNTNEGRTLTMEENAYNTSNSLLGYRQQLHELNNGLVDLSGKISTMEGQVSTLESDWTTSSNQVAALKNGTNDGNGDIYALDSAMGQYFNFYDGSTTYNLYENAFNYNVPNVRVSTTLQSKNGLTVRTSSQTRDTENFKICDDNQNCMHLSVQNNGFYLTPENVGKFSIMSGTSSLADFNMTNNTISLGKHEDGINNGLGRPMVIKDGFVFMDGFDVVNCDHVVVAPPAPVVPAPSPIACIIQVACGWDYSLFLSKNGEVKACGDNTYGQLGTGNSATKVSNIENVVNLSLPVIQVDARYNHTLFLLNNCQVKACGENYSGELGIGNKENKNVPTTIVNLSEGVKQIAAGVNYSAFLLKNGQVKACGDNSHGQWGASSPGNGGTPTLVPNVSEIKQIACGWGHTIYLDINKNVKSNGLNNDGQIGRTGNNKTVGNISITDVKKVACGNQHTIILMNNGTIQGYGISIAGVLTNPNDYNSSEVSDVFCGHYKTFVLLKNGKIIRFGSEGWKSDDWYGKVIDNPINSSSSDKAIYVSSANKHEIYILSNGDVKGRGGNDFGQLGPEGSYVSLKKIDVGIGCETYEPLQSCGVPEPIAPPVVVAPPDKDDTPHFVGSLDGANGFSILLPNGNAYVIKGPSISLGFGKTLNDPPILTNVRKIVHGVYHSIFVLADGNVMTGGYSTKNNNLGYVHSYSYNESIPLSEPLFVGTKNGVRIVDAFAGYFDTVFLSENGDAYLNAYQEPKYVNVKSVVMNRSSSLIDNHTVLYKNGLIMYYSYQPDDVNGNNDNHEIIESVTIRSENRMPKPHSIYGISSVWGTNMTSTSLTNKLVWLDMDGDVWHGNYKMPVIGTTNGKPIKKVFHHCDKHPFYFLDTNNDLYSAVRARNSKLKHYYANYGRIGRLFDISFEPEDSAWIPALVDTVGGSRGLPVKSVHITDSIFYVILENNDVYKTFDDKDRSMLFNTLLFDNNQYSDDQKQSWEQAIQKFEKDNEEYLDRMLYDQEMSDRLKELF